MLLQRKSSFASPEKPPSPAWLQYAKIILELFLKQAVSATPVWHLIAGLRLVGEMRSVDHYEKLAVLGDTPRCR